MRNPPLAVYLISLYTHIDELLLKYPNAATPKYCQRNFPFQISFLILSLKLVGTKTRKFLQVEIRYSAHVCKTFDSEFHGVVYYLNYNSFILTMSFETKLPIAIYIVYFIILLREGSIWEQAGIYQWNLACCEPRFKSWFCIQNDVSLQPLSLH